MKSEICKMWQLVVFFMQAFFTFKKKVILFCIPSHPNLGDQAQLMCTEKWIKEKFSKYKMLSIGLLFSCYKNNPKELFFNYSFFAFVVLKMTIRKKDVFIGHSGYFFTDHHGGWLTYDFLLQHWNNRFIILPQTINFYSPFVKKMVSKTFSNRGNLTIFCRDEVSYKNAKQLFGTTKLFLFPDIVTSLIGTRIYNTKREGVLFCMRDDIESFYSELDIDGLMLWFGNVRKEKIDTTLKISSGMMRKYRDDLINEMIEKMSTYQVVITDRYHGTIFSAIANTPVIVINSTDHKLSSGVKWFPADIFGKNVQYAENFQDAYEKANYILKENANMIVNPPFFKEKYWDVLIENLIE